MKSTATQTGYKITGKLVGSLFNENGASKDQVTIVTLKDETQLGNLIYGLVMNHNYYDLKVEEEITQ
jgi:hypothetical protein